MKNYLKKCKDKSVKRTKIQALIIENLRQNIGIVEGLTRTIQ